MMINKLFFLFLTSFSILPISKNITVETLLQCLNKTKHLRVVKHEGEFSNIYSNEKKGLYISIFKGDIGLQIKYIKNYASDRDTIVINHKKLLISQKLDPDFLNVYTLKFYEKRYLCLLGKAQSASGSGAQRTFYVLTEIIGSTIKNPLLFDSRFGIINNIGDFNNDGKLDYFKVVNDPSKMDRYIGQAYSIEEPEKVIDKNKYVRMTNEIDEMFSIDNYLWFQSLSCIP